MKASRLIFTLLLAWSVAVAQLVAQPTKADQKPIEEVKAKAEAGNAKSQVELGLRYDKAAGVLKDRAEAAKWYRKAAEQNYAPAQNNLGLCYEHGEGVAADRVQAMKWYRKAAEQNDADAQFNLGMCYERADAGTEDWAEVYKWLSLAAGQGYEGAKKFMTVLESKLMTPEQITQGQKRAREFKPR